ncbi:glycoside hydrolase [Daedaleopsis nitida]|nr:glycoside hydrolase [Daedaleopsis nitida]
MAQQGPSQAMSSTPYQPVHTNINYPDNSNDRNTQFYTPETEHLQLHDDLPAGAAPPRFMGAGHLDGPDRSSFASSQHTLQGDDGSTYALNDMNKPGFYGLNYNDSAVNTNQGPYGSSPYLNEKSAYAPKARSRKRAIIIGSAVALVVIAGAALAVYFAVIKPKQDKNDTSGKTASGDSSNDNSSSSNTGATKNLAVSGGDGSTVTMDDGSTFTYTNPYGGTWYYDPKNPFVSGARAQEWTPALNETLKFGENPIYGWCQPWWLARDRTGVVIAHTVFCPHGYISVPALYEPYVNTSNPVYDEWDLCERLRSDPSTGGIDVLENHYKTFITEKDFIDIAAAGLNFVRIPIGFWAIETRENEPFLAKSSWTYVLKAVEWARKYGLRINLDLHALPGSQNGWNHSGRLGDINVLYGPMGIANAQRSLDYIRIIAEFISQPEYRDVIVMFGVTNEPFGPTIGKDAIKRFHVQAYNTVRQASGVGEGNGPYVVIHDAFLGLPEYSGFLPNADRMQLDIHRYLCFDGQSADDYDTRVAAGQPCTAWATAQNDSMTAFGMTHVGEWSLGINDCGEFLNGVGLGARFDGTFSASKFPFTGSCVPYLNYPDYTDDFKSGMKEFALQSMSALQNWFFWTWKIGNSTVTGIPTSPAWSYQLGLQEGWMPTDPRQAIGACDNTDPFNPPLQAWQTGGAGAGTVPQTFLDQFSWPPTTLANEDNVAALPQYTPTGSIVTLPGPSITATGVTVGSGWNNPTDTTSMYVPVATCGYLDPWIGSSKDLAACPPLARREYAPRAGPTPPPSR